MGRHFLQGFAVTLVLLLIGLRLEARFPDAAGPGEESVSFHGVCVYRRPIVRVEPNSGRQALLVAIGVVILGSAAGGGLALVVSLLRKPPDQGVGIDALET